jgi:hypothetical protein
MFDSDANTMPNDARLHGNFEQLDTYEATYCFGPLNIISALYCQESSFNS